MRLFYLPDEPAQRSHVLPAIVNAIIHAGPGSVVKVGDATRTEAQNRLLHPLLDDISKQAFWMGKPRPMLQWKTLIVSGHTIATGGQTEMTVGLEGEVVNLRESTASMGKKRFTSLVEYTYAWGADNGVTFRTDRGSLPA